MTLAAHWEPLDPKHHGALMWRRFTRYHFARHTLMTPLADAELRHAAACFPMAFVNGDQGWQAVALLGLDDTHNLMVDADGRWQAAYVPSALRSHPFGLHPDAPGQLCIDTHSPCVVEALDGEPLFQQQGGLAHFPQQVLRFLTQRAQGCQRVAKALSALDQARLLTPWAPKAYQGSVTLHQVDESAWQSLTDTQLGLFWQLGAVPMVYAQLQSQHQMGRLLAYRQRRTPPAPAASPADTSSTLAQWQEALNDEEQYHWQDPRK